MPRSLDRGREIPFDPTTKPDSPPGGRHVHRLDRETINHFEMKPERDCPDCLARDQELAAACAAVKQHEVSIASLERVRDKQAESLRAADALDEAAADNLRHLLITTAKHNALHSAVRAYRAARTTPEGGEMTDALDEGGRT
jgi:hypothetical protein